jgi:lambda family phage portal protein
MSKAKTYSKRQKVDFGKVRASYDVARTTTDNANLWSNTDSLSAAQANSPSVRKIIRERARYEVANNSYADGIIDTITSELLGSWITIKLGMSDIAKQAEKDFQTWALESKFWHKLHQMIRSKKVDGETFALLTNNPRLRNGVKLNVKPIECDMVESYWNLPSENEIDGIKFDQWGNPIAYRVLKYHPGDYRINLKSTGGDWVDADFVIHFFAANRPGQVRGISELTPSLNLYAQLRSYTTSVIEAASRAAEIAGVIETDLVPDTTDGRCAADVEAGSIIPAGRNKIISCPEGWKVKQFTAEQPTTTYQMFKHEIISEMGRCLNMPKNVAACDSSGYNYASGRLDHQTYDRNNSVERFFIETEILDRVYEAWLKEYAIYKRLTVDEVDGILVAEWFFASRGHVDPNKEASADDTRFANGSLSLSNYYAGRGQDGDTEITNMLQEKIDMITKWRNMLRAAGLPENTPMPNVAPSGNQQQQKPIEEGDENDDKQKDADTE